MRGLLGTFCNFLLFFFVYAEYYTIDLAVTRYKALNYQEAENLEHLPYHFDFCLCAPDFIGLFPDKSKECQCSLQQKARTVVESIPHAVFSSSCVLNYNPAKCLSAKFTTTNIGHKILVRVKIGKTIFTYPSWQSLVFSSYKTISTLKSAAGSDMRITYISTLRRITGEFPFWTKPVSTTTAVSWRKQQPAAAIDTDSSFDPLSRNDIFDIIRENYIKEKISKSVTPEPKIIKTAKQPWLIWTTTVSPLPTTMTTRDVVTTTQKTTTTPVPTTKNRPTINRRTDYRKIVTSQLTTKRPAPSWPMRNPWDLSDVAFIRDVDDVKNFLLKRSMLDKVSPINYDVQTVKDKLVFYHNLYREQHDASEVRENAYLDSLAQRYADHLAYSRSCLVHEYPRVYGENLFVYGSQDFPNPEIFAKVVTQSFYMEAHSYNYNSWYPQSYHRTGHFTQLVWRESRQIGIGISIIRTDGYNRGLCFPHSPAYMIYVCVKYDPAGNLETSEAYKRNVLPLKRF